MTGVLNALVATQSGLYYAVTTASLGTPTGYESGVGGSMSSTTFKGETFDEVWSQSTPSVVALRIKLLTAGLAQSFFSQVTVQCDDGTFRTLRTADANFSDVGATVWQWSGFTSWGTAAVVRAFWIL